jgi:dihydroorotate dehydrogenase (fumarate)/dihydroorotate dehydrogenase
LNPCADYICLNLSCPNSELDRDFFDDVAHVDLLLQHVGKQSELRPVFLKLKPPRDAGYFKEILSVAKEHPCVAGFAINLPSGKPETLSLATPRERLIQLPGAVAGKPSEALCNDCVTKLYSLIRENSRFVIIAAGGVFSAEDAYRKLRLGASLVQLYTGLVYRGPGIVRSILKGLVELSQRDGFTHVSQAIGAEFR